MGCTDGIPQMFSDQPELEREQAGHLKTARRLTDLRAELRKMLLSPTAATTETVTYVVPQTLARRLQELAG